MGDEGHNRNKAGSLLYLKWLAPLIARVTPDTTIEGDVLKFLGDNALSVLNPVMAACKAMADAAHMAWRAARWSAPWRATAPISASG